MKTDVVNGILSNFIMNYVSVLMVYLFICTNFKLKIDKRKAYVIAILCSIYMPLIDSVLGILVGSKIIPLTVTLIVLIKTSSFLGEIVMIIFLITVVKTPWYRCYWFTIIMQVVIILPYPLLYANYFMIPDPVKGTIHTPITLDNIILYLFFLLISAVWGLAVIFIGRLKKPVIWLEKVSKLSWGILYLLWSFLIFNTDKYVNTDEYKKVLNVENNNQLFSWFSTVDEVVIYLFVIAIIIMVSVNISERKHLKIENQLLKEMLDNQYLNYLSMQEQDMEIHKLYHDIGNHVDTIRVLVSSGEHMEATEYTANLVQQYRNIRKNYYCSNRIINAVLLQKFKLCEQKQIEYEVELKLPEELPIKDIDLMSVFSNLMDNAIEGCLRNTETNNIIRVKTAVVGNYFTIKIINTKHRDNAAKTGANSFVTWKADKKMHGYGLKILEGIIHRYDGQKELKDLGNEFSAMVMLKLPVSSEQLNQKKLLA